MALFEICDIIKEKITMSFVGFSEFHLNRSKLITFFQLSVHVWLWTYIFNLIILILFPFNYFSLIFICLILFICIVVTYSFKENNTLKFIICTVIYVSNGITIILHFLALRIHHSIYKYNRLYHCMILK